MSVPWSRLVVLNLLKIRAKLDLLFSINVDNSTETLNKIIIEAQKNRSLGMFRYFNLKPHKVGTIIKVFPKLSIWAALCSRKLPLLNGQKQKNSHKKLQRFLASLSFPTFLGRPYYIAQERKFHLTETYRCVFALRLQRKNVI